MFLLGCSSEVLSKEEKFLKLVNEAFIWNFEWQELDEYLHETQCNRQIRTF